MLPCRHGTVVRRPFTDQYLLEYSSNHVYYEIDHFLWLAEKLDKQILIGAASPEDVTKVNNVLIEGFGLHLRNVIDFLYPRGSVRPDDIIAADFFAPRSWDALKPAPLSDSLVEARIRSDKEMAHLTTARITGTPPEKQWDFSGIASELKLILRLMCDNALATRLAPNVTNRIRQ